jgi:hypothetical protein
MIVVCQHCRDKCRRINFVRPIVVYNGLFVIQPQDRIILKDYCLLLRRKKEHKLSHTIVVEIAIVRSIDDEVVRGLRVKVVVGKRIEMVAGRVANVAIRNDVGTNRRGWLSRHLCRRQIRRAWMM